MTQPTSPAPRPRALRASSASRWANGERFTTPLLLPGQSGVLALLNASAAPPLRMTIRRRRLEFLPGKPSAMLVYEVDRHGAALINPVLVIRQGETFAADVTNHLDEATNIHWHGLSVDWQMDGRSEERRVGK